MVIVSKIIPGRIPALLLSVLMLASLPAFARTSKEISGARVALRLQGCEASSQLRAVVQFDRLVTQIQRDSDQVLPLADRSLSEGVCDRIHQAALGKELQGQARVLETFEKVIASVQDLDDAKCVASLRRGRDATKAKLEAVRAKLGQKCSL